MEKLIVVNSGSASKKYALYEGSKSLMTFHFEENVESTDSKYLLHVKNGEKFSKEALISSEEYENAFRFTVEFLIKNSYLKDAKDLKSVVFRVVAPGSYFLSDRVIGPEFLDKLEESRCLAPMHIEKMKSEFVQISDYLHDVKMIAVSDSRFHKNMPDEASIYALPQKITDDLDVKRFGYHGISVSSVVSEIKKDKGSVPEKVIICHLGGGSSITALKNGETIENSMGYSPLEGLPMSTRIGNIDFGAVLVIAEKLDLEIKEIRDLMYNECGLMGISAYSGDIRDLLNEAGKGNKKASLALDKYTYEIKKTIGSYIAILGGLDLLVFTGTIGERSSPIRESVCSGLEFLGIEIDLKTNKILSGEPGYINRPNSPVPIEVIYTNEVDEMARRAIDLI